MGLTSTWSPLFAHSADGVWPSLRVQCLHALLMSLNPTRRRQCEHQPTTPLSIILQAVKTLDAGIFPTLEFPHLEAKSLYTRWWVLLLLGDNNVITSLRDPSWLAYSQWKRFAAGISPTWSPHSAAWISHSEAKSFYARCWVLLSLGDGNASASIRVPSRLAYRQLKPSAAEIFSTQSATKIPRSAVEIFPTRRR